MKKIIILYLFFISILTLNAQNINYEKVYNSDYNEFPIAVQKSKPIILSDRQDNQMQLMNMQIKNLLFCYKVYKNENGNLIEIDTTYFINENETILFWKDYKKYTFKSKLNTNILENSLYTQSVYEVYNLCEENYIPEFNRFGNWSGQVTLSPSGKVAIFSSDFRGNDNLDLYAIIKNEYGNWGRPIALEQLNTKGDEILPYFGNDGRFYYSSNFKNDTISDFDIRTAYYIPKDKVLLPFQAVSCDKINSNFNDISLISDLEKFYFASDRPAENTGYNLYSYPAEKKGICLKIKTNLSEIWVKNINLSEYYCFPSNQDIYLQKGYKYNVITIPEFLDTNKNAVSNIDLDFTNIEKDTTFEFNIKYAKNNIEKFVVLNSDSSPVFVRGYWKPFNKVTYNELKNEIEKGRFINNNLVDTSLLNYQNYFVKTSEQKELFFKDILNTLTNYNSYIPSNDSLFIDLTVFSNEIKIKSTSSKNTNLYIGGEIEVYIPELNRKIIIPDSTDIKNRSWSSKKQKVKFKNDGNELLAYIRSYYTYKYIDSILKGISPVYKYHYLNKTLVFNYKGIVNDESNEIPKDYIILKINNKKNETKSSELFEIAKQFVFSKSNNIAETKIDANPNSLPIPKMANAMQSNNMIENLERKAFQKLKNTETEKNRDSVYTIELFRINNANEANRIYDILKSKLVKDIKIITVYNFLGQRTYSIRADRFEKYDDANNAMREYRWVYSYVSAEGNCEVVLEFN